MRQQWGFGETVKVPRKSDLVIFYSLLDYLAQGLSDE